MSSQQTGWWYRVLERLQQRRIASAGRLGTQALFQPLEPRVMLSGSDLAGLLEDDGGFATVLEGNVAVQIELVKFADSVVEGESAKGKVKIIVSNTSDLRLAEDMTATVQLLAVPEGGGDPILLGQKTNDALSELKPGEVKIFTIPFQLDPNLAVGNYSFSAKVVQVDDPEDEVSEDSEESFEIAAAEVNLSTRISKSQVPLTFHDNQKVKGNVKVTINNDGNTDLPDDSEVDVLVKLRPVGAVDDSQDIIIGQDDVSVDGLQAGKSRVANIKVEIEDIPAGDYNLVVLVTPQGDLEESDDSDNEHVSDDDYAVVEGGVDLRIHEPEVEVELEDDGTEAKAELKILNAGNAAAVGQVTVTVRAIDADDVEHVVATQVVNVNLLPGKKQKVKLDLTFPDVQAPADFDVFIDIESGDIVEVDTANNSVDAGTVTIVPFVAATINDIAFTETVAPALDGTDMVSSGTLLTGNGDTGAYSWRVTEQGTTSQQRTALLTITLDEPGEPQGDIVIQLKFEELADRPLSLNGLTLNLLQEQDDADVEDDELDDEEDDGEDDLAGTLGEFKVLSFGDLDVEFEGYFNLTQTA